MPPSASMVYVSAQYPMQTPMTGGAAITGSVTEQVAIPPAACPLACRGRVDSRYLPRSRASSHAQTTAVLANVMGCLKEAGVSDLKSLVKVTVYLTNVASMAEVSACLSRELRPPDNDQPSHALLRDDESHLRLGSCAAALPVRRGVHEVDGRREAGANGGAGAGAARWPPRVRRSRGCDLVSKPAATSDEVVAMMRSCVLGSARRA